MMQIPANTTIQNTATLKNSRIGWSDSAGLSRSALGVTLAHRVARVVARHVLAACEWLQADMRRVEEGGVRLRDRRLRRTVRQVGFRGPPEARDEVADDGKHGEQCRHP